MVRKSLFLLLFSLYIRSIRRKKVQKSRNQKKKEKSSIIVWSSIEIFNVDIIWKSFELCECVHVCIVNLDSEHFLCNWQMSISKKTQKDVTLSPFTTHLEWKWKRIDDDNDDNNNNNVFARIGVENMRKFSIATEYYQLKFSYGPDKHEIST